MPVLASRGALCAKGFGFSNGFGFKDITVVGTKTGSAQGGDVTLTFDATPLPGDVVLVFGGTAGVSPPGYPGPGPTTAGYTSIFNVNVGADPGFDVSYKVMGSSPDTSVVCAGTGNSTYATVYACYILRNVASTVIDTAVTSAGPTTGTNPNSPSITTVTEKAMVLSLAISGNDDSTVTAPSGYSNAISVNRSEISSWTTAGATIIKTTPGVEDPPSWTTWGTGEWRAVSVALRPKRR